MTSVANNTSMPERVYSASPWSPLQEPLFRGLWIAALMSHTGTWIQSVGIGWLMTSLTTSPVMVGMVQVAMSLPVFLISLPAGALADLVDRRKLLIVTQSWMMVIAATLGIVTVLGWTTPWLLLMFVFLLGLGAVMNDPAWQSITPEVVSGEQHASAVALNSAGFNVARAIGPALGGIVIAAAGPGATFLINACSFLGVIYFLYRWKRRTEAPETSSQRFRAAMGDGIRYMRSTPAVQWVLLRTMFFSFCASAIWALLPLIALPFGSVGYGLLLGWFGTGAVAAAGILARLRRKVAVETLVAGGILLFSVVTLAAAAFSNFVLLCASLAAGGAAWITILSSLNLTVQTTAPAALRARALSMYLLVLQGGLAAGSAVWGVIAAEFSLGAALGIAAAGLITGLLAVGRFPSERRLEVSTPATS